ncbi:MAG: peptide chain release factor 2 [Actinobacteria bacterium]|nr:MAG: peptide chain release factor 2 [Actinomycetota bacterium]
MSYHRVPKGEVEIRRESPVNSSDGHHLGHVVGFVIDDQQRIEHLVLVHGHLWGKHEAAIPGSAIDRLANDELTLSLSRAAVQARCWRTIFDPDALGERAGALERQMGEAGFWNDQERAAAITAEHARASRKLTAYRELERDVEDLEPLAELAEEDPEIASELEQQISSVQERLEAQEEQRLFSGRYDSGDALVTVNAGTGGTDAQDWAEMVLRMQMRWAEKRGFEVELLEVSPGEEAGIKSATFLIRGENVYGLFASEKGVHRLVRLSPFDAAHRRHTSFAGVEVSPVVQEIDEVPIDDEDLQIDTYRASGAGGQHVNKTDSAVRITHKPTGIVVQCQNERSQSSNKAEAMTMLRSKLLELEERKRREEIARERGEAQDVNFGSQIRSYVLHPYTMVKDHRTGHEVGDVSRVLDGDLDGFARAYLLKAASANGAHGDRGRA